MEIIYHSKALEEFEIQEFEIREKFSTVYELIIYGHSRNKKKFKKIKRTILFELRVKHLKLIYRGLGAYYKKNYFVNLVFFQKKSQKIPLRFIKLALKRYSDLN